jgi:hypothetical protein
VKAITGVTGMSTHRRRNGNVAVGYMAQAALKRKYDGQKREK